MSYFYHKNKTNKLSKKEENEALFNTMKKAIKTACISTSINSKELNRLLKHNTEDVADIDKMKAVSGLSSTKLKELEIQATLESIETPRTFRECYFDLLSVENIKSSRPKK